VRLRFAVRDVPASRASSLPLPVRPLVRLHRVAMHDNTSVLITQKYTHWSIDAGREATKKIEVGLAASRR
jgi:hypothetical protein